MAQARKKKKDVEFCGLYSAAQNSISLLCATPTNGKYALDATARREKVGGGTPPSNLRAQAPALHDCGGTCHDLPPCLLPSPDYRPSRELPRLCSLRQGRPERRKGQPLSFLLAGEWYSTSPDVFSRVGWRVSRDLLFASGATLRKRIGTKDAPSLLISSAARERGMRAADLRRER